MTNKTRAHDTQMVHYKDVSAMVEIREREERIQSVWLRGQFYEHEMLKFMEERYPKGGLYIDVGASIGNHTLFFRAVMNACVISIEPLMDSAAHMVANLSLNNLRVGNGIWLYPCAVGDGPGQVLMEGIRIKGQPLSVMSAQMEAARAFNGPNAHRLHVVDVYALDRLVHDYLTNRQLATASRETVGLRAIKIDVEDYNMPVLRGAADTLSRYRPDLYIESVKDFEEVTELLDLLGYTYGGHTFNATPTHLFEPKPALRRVVI